MLPDKNQTALSPATSSTPARAQRRPARQPKLYGKGCQDAPRVPDGRRGRDHARMRSPHRRPPTDAHPVAGRPQSLRGPRAHLGRRAARRRSPDDPCPAGKGIPPANRPARYICDLPDSCGIDGDARTYAHGHGHMKEARQAEQLEGSIGI